MRNGQPEQSGVAAAACGPHGGALGELLPQCCRISSVNRLGHRREIGVLKLQRQLAAMRTIDAIQKGTAPLHSPQQHRQRQQDETAPGGDTRLMPLRIPEQGRDRCQDQ